MNWHVVALTFVVFFNFASLDCGQSDEAPPMAKENKKKQSNALRRREKGGALVQAKNDAVKKANEDMFCVIIWPRTTLVPFDINDRFEVLLRVVNATEKPQTFKVLGTSWCNHWKISGTKETKLIRYGWASLKNTPVTINLEPGEAWEKVLPMVLLDDGPPPVLISFKMGFTPLDGDTIYWSNKVVIGIKPGKRGKGENKRKK